jgi:hypothetical protein
MLERSQSIIDLIQKLPGFSQPLQAKLKPTVFHADLCVNSAQYSVKLSQREIELGGHGFQLAFGLPKNASIICEQEKRVVIRLLSLFLLYLLGCCAIVLKDTTITQKRKNRLGVRGGAKRVVMHS